MYTMNMDLKKELSLRDGASADCQSPQCISDQEQDFSKQQYENQRSNSSNMAKVYQSSQEGLTMKSEKQPDVDQEAAAPVEPFKYAGYLGGILSSFIASLAMLCVKLLPVEDSIGEKAKAGMFRGMFMMLFCGMTVVQQGLSFKVPRGEYSVNLARAVLGGINIMLAYISIQFVTIGERSAVSYLYCLWTSLLGFILLKEQLKITLLIAVPVSFLGVILIAMPSLIVDPEDEVIELLPPDHNLTNTTETSGSETVEILDEYYLGHRWIGIVTSLVGSLTSSMSTIVLKFRKKTPIVTCSFYLGLALVLVTIGTQMVVGFAPMPSTRLEWFLHVCIGFLSYLSQCLYQWALQFVPAGTYATVLSVEIVLSYFLGVVFLHDLILWTSLAGSAIIVSVVILLVLNDRLVRCFR